VGAETDTLVLKTREKSFACVVANVVGDCWHQVQARGWHGVACDRDRTAC
jgi:hypothetical protein